MCLRKKENNQNLQEKFSSYSKEELGIEKNLSEYVLVVAGTTTTAENGETVYIVRIYDKDGDSNQAFYNRYQSVTLNNRAKCIADETGQKDKETDT